MMKHIRAKLKPIGGNSFYRDKRIRESTTLCGNEPALYDVSFSDARFVKNIVGVCEECKQLYCNPKRKW